MKPRLGVRRSESIRKNHYEISNKHLFSNNKLSTKEKTQLLFLNTLKCNHL